MELSALKTPARNDGRRWERWWGRWLVVKMTTTNVPTKSKHKHCDLPMGRNAHLILYFELTRERGNSKTSVAMRVPLIGYDVQFDLPHKRYLQHFKLRTFINWKFMKYVLLIKISGQPHLFRNSTQCRRVEKVSLIGLVIGWIEHPRIYSHTCWHNKYEEKSTPVEQLIKARWKTPVCSFSLL